MLRLVADANFNGDIVRGVLRIEPKFEIVRVQNIDLADAEDPEILAWAADNDRIVVTHDRSTMPDHAFARVASGEMMRGVFVVNDRLPVREAISELLLMNTCSEQVEWLGRVVYLPL